MNIEMQNVLKILPLGDLEVKLMSKVAENERKMMNNQDMVNDIQDFYNASKEPVIKRLYMSKGV